MQAAAEREAKEPNLNEFPENDDSIEETVDDTFHVNNRLEDDMDHQGAFQNYLPKFTIAISLALIVSRASIIPF
jgi:hypothetical protein